MQGPSLSVLVKYPGGAMETHRFAATDLPVKIGSDWRCSVLVTLVGVAPVHAEVVRDAESLGLVYQSDARITILRAASRPLQIEPRLWKLEVRREQITSFLLDAARVQIDLEWMSGSKRVAAPAAEGSELDGWEVNGGAHAFVRPAAVRPQRREEWPPAGRGPDGGRVEIALVTRGCLKEFSFPPGAAISVGRTRTCDVHVPDEVEGVSRLHARLHWSNGWLVLEDCESTNGTWINNQSVKRVVLRGAASHQVELGQSGASISIRVLGDTHATIIGTSPTSKEREATQVSSATYKLLEERLAEQERQLVENQRTLQALEASHLEHERRRSERDRFVHELEQARLQAENQLEAERRRIEEERHANQRAREAIVKAHSDFNDAPPTDPTIPALALDDDIPHPAIVAPVEAAEPSEPSWLAAIPVPDRSVFQHLAVHGSINEEEVVRLLGSPRQFRRFCGQLETLVLHCPFGVRIETSGGLKCYVRTDESRIEE